MNYQNHEPRLPYRSRNGIIFGVCAGLAEHFELPPWGMRLLFILPMFTGVAIPFMIGIYIVMAILMKPHPVELGPETMSSQDPFRGIPRNSHVEMLSRVQERFDALDKRLQRMESIVTRPGFGLEQKYRDLQ